MLASLAGVQVLTWRGNDCVSQRAMPNQNTGASWNVRVAAGGVAAGSTGSRTRYCTRLPEPRGLVVADVVAERIVGVGHVDAQPAPVGAVGPPTPGGREGEVGGGGAERGEDREETHSRLRPDAYVEPTAASRASAACRSVAR